MKLNDIVMASTQDTKIRVVVKLYGTSFRTEHFPEYFLESEEMDELMDREVVDIRVVDNLLLSIGRSYVAATNAAPIIEFAGHFFN